MGFRQNWAGPVDKTHVMVGSNAGELAEYLAHYNGHRPHRALGQLAPLTVDSPPPIDDLEPAELSRNDAVSGLIHEYRLVA